MKIVTLLLFALLASLISYSQEPAEGVFPLKDSSIYYEKIVSIDSSTKENIYKGVKSWGVNAFRSQKDVLQADDKELGLIAYKYWFDETFNAPPVLGTKVSSEWKYWATMKIFIRDAKVKIIVQDVDIKEIGGATPSIRTLRADIEPYYKKGMFGKSYRDKYFEEAKINFQKADKSIVAMIDELILYLKSGKSEFDF